MFRSVERPFKRIVTAFLRILLASRRRSDFTPSASPNILVIRQHNQLGDMLCVVPLLRALRNGYPTSRIALMASPVNHDVMEHNRYIDEIIMYDKREFIGRRGSLLRLPRYVQLLRRKRFDIAVVPSTVSTSFTSDLLAYLSGARIRLGAGSIDGVENPSAFFFTHPRALDWRNGAQIPQVVRNMEIWPSLSARSSDLSIEITLTEDELRDAKSLIDNWDLQSRRIVIYHPGAGKPPNRWPAEHFATVANELSERENVFTVITSGPMDVEVVRAMMANLEKNAYLIENKPIRSVASILHFADLVVSNDTGIMHVAAGVGAPVLSLFGPTDPEQWAPIDARHRYLRGEGGDISRIPPHAVLECARAMLQTGAR